MVGYIQYLFCRNLYIRRTVVTRGDQKVLQFSMMYKWHRQNNKAYIIFQYTFHICQKVLLFQLIIIKKPRSVKLLLQMSK